MAFDDPVVWVLIVVIVVFLFGSSKIPQIARGLGQAKREFDRASKGLYDSESQNTLSSSPNTTEQRESNSSTACDDPLMVAALKEGIDTNTKTREQIASELAWKLKKGS